MKKINFNCNGWKEFEGDTLPDSAQEFIKSKLLPHNNRNWKHCFAYYKGNDPQTTKNWIIVTDDGGYYKVDAEYMIWSEKHILAMWSTKHLFKTLTAIMMDFAPPKDPDYQT